MRYEDKLLAGYTTAALAATYQSEARFRPEFLSNNPEMGKKVLSSIEEELAHCDQFRISVAFITKSGIVALKQILLELEERGIPGEILTTDYLTFSEPEALKQLAKLKNIKLRMFRTSGKTGGFHTKGYIFKKEEIYRIIIGSSNLTLSAITRNREWNTKIVSTEQGELAQNILEEFDALWNAENTQDYADFIEDYTNSYQAEKEKRKREKAEVDALMEKHNLNNLKPNTMQAAFIHNVVNMVKNGATKALLTSSTGTGKTYASAFAMRELHPKRLLFIVHREQIAKQAMYSYKRIFGVTKTFGLVTGNAKDLDRDFIFATMQMMSKPDVYTKFDVNTFDAIVLDECHHAGSSSYQKIMNYFKPKFWLGMTASPDNNNYDIYSLFDHNIAYDIRLQQALDEDLLCPFHYFGITDLTIDGNVFDDNTGVRNFSALVSDERVNYVLKKAEYFGYSGDRVHGLIFCGRKEEAKELSAKFNLRHKEDGTFYKTAVLTGENSQEEREKVIDCLTAETDDPKAIDYILTVDIFNEGVDIPEINQVIMLRPTESPVIFIQQLGRGLRKYSEKEYVVVLDFIGNYMNNFMIPIALSGDRSYNKDAMRRFVTEGDRVIPGSSTIHFDEISKTRIYASIDAAKTNDTKLIKDSYTSLKYKLGRIPTIMEFKEYGSIDVTKIFDKFGSYYAFLKKFEPDYTCTLTTEESLVIEYMSKKLVSYKRIHELVLLKMLIEKNTRLVSYYEQIMKQNYGITVTPVMEESVYRNLANLFAKDVESKKYYPCVFVERDTNGNYRIAPGFQVLLQNPEFKNMVMELLTFGEDRYQENYSRVYKDTCFQLYQKYTYEDVCRLLGWEKNMNAQNIGGYFYDAKTKTLPVFINYDKAEDAIQYEDRFISENQLIALSKHPRSITSADAKHIYKTEPDDQENRIFLFVRKNKDDKEAKEFYFLGEIYAEGHPTQIQMDKTKDNAFEILYRLDVPVRSDIYDYIVME